MSDQYAELAAQNEALREALAKYAKHPDSCPKGVGIGIYKPPRDARCDCGIAAALAATPSASLAKHDEKVRAEEREACARAVEAQPRSLEGYCCVAAVDIAAAIRARATKGETT